VVSEVTGLFTTGIFEKSAGERAKSALSASRRILHLAAKHRTRVAPSSRDGSTAPVMV
jgi:hypothetical protein